MGTQRPRGFFGRWNPEVLGHPTVVLAAIAILFSLFFAHKQNEANQISSSLALHNSIVNSRSYQELLDIGKILWYEFKKSKENQSSGTPRERFRNASEKRIAENEIRIRAWIEEFLVSTNVLYNCAWGTKPECSKEILFRTHFEYLLEIYDTMQYGIYCDEYVINTYMNDTRTSGGIYNLETMIMEYYIWKKKERSSNVTPFRTHSEKEYSRKFDGDGKAFAVRPELREGKESICDH